MKKIMLNTSVESLEEIQLSLINIVDYYNKCDTVTKSTIEFLFEDYNKLISRQINLKNNIHILETIMFKSENQKNLQRLKTKN